jgi:cytochrome c peroxidase
MVFPAVALGGPITYVMAAQAIAEWEATKVRANAPLDKFMRGALDAMTVDQKLGALLFFGKANCVACHATAGSSNQMFSDFKFHDIGVPQIAPFFGAGRADVIFDGPGQNEDFGLEQFTGNSADRYKFRTSPLRNVALQSAFFHNGSFKNLALAIHHHLDALNSARSYVPVQNGVPADLRRNMGPIEPVLALLDPLVAQPPVLTDDEFKQLVAFVRDALLDPKNTVVDNCRDIPSVLPSRMQQLTFAGCAAGANDHGEFVAARMGLPDDVR